jgi:hypothetical protein
MESKMHFARLAQFAVLGTALVIGSQANAGALSYGTYYDETVLSQCGVVNQCRVNFSQLPPDKLVLVRKIHCQVSTQQQPAVMELFVSATLGGGPIARDLPLQFLPNQPGTSALSDGFLRYTVNVETQWLVGQSRFPYISIFAPTANSMTGDCTIIGDLVTPIQ